MKPEELRVMVVGAHPDDADLNFGCTALRLTAAGSRVRFVSVGQGDKGHQTMFGPALAARRKLEAQASAKILGVEDYSVLNCLDCEIENTQEVRKELTRIIRAFSPHIVLTHRTCDYHADHRAVGTAIMDITYFLGVPGWCPDAPIPTVRPAVFYLRDTFTVPRELRPDVIVPVADPALRKRYLSALACHVSQFAEWLPFDKGILDECPPWDDIRARDEFLSKYWLLRKRIDAGRFCVKNWAEVEVFEQSEYGRQLSPSEIREIFGEDSIVLGRNWTASR